MRSLAATGGWSIALVLAVLWPGRIVGPLDGAPLDVALEAVVIGLVLPLTWLLYPQFLRSAIARALIFALLAWKIATALLLTQGGWCAEFLTPYPPPGTYRLDRSWDARTYWTPSPPACSAIVSRRLDTPADFPGWVINVPYEGDWILSEGPTAVPPEPPKPPNGAYRMLLFGVLRPKRPGTLGLDLGGDVRIDGSIDGQPLLPQRGGMVMRSLSPGEHAVAVQLWLVGSDWRFVPRWNDHDLFATVPTGLTSATFLDGAVDGWGLYVTPVIILLLLGTWVASALRRFRLNRGLVVWLAISTSGAIAVAASHSDFIFRLGFVLLLGAVAVPVPPRLRNWRGAVLLLGVPWVCVFAVRSVPEVGRFTSYSFGDDWTSFQQYAYEIFMQGYWLHGGEHWYGHPSGVFWHQPLYRWIVGVLHLTFGDSSVGELYWDMAGIFIGALVSFEIVKRFVGFQLGIAAGAVTLATATLGPTAYLIGRGMSEISASAWIGLAALALLRTRSGDARYAVLAGICGVLAFYTRLNHLLLLAALVALVLPEDVPADALWHLRTVWSRLPKRVAFVYLACAAVGICAFAARTSHYAGHLTLFGGQEENQATGLGSSLQSLWSLSAWSRAAESVLMIVTVQDPPRFDVRSLLVVMGVVAALLAIVRGPIVRRLPLGLVTLCLGSIAGGLVARGVAYTGRFSIHLIPIAIAVSFCLVGLAVGVPVPSDSRQVDASRES